MNEEKSFVTFLVSTINQNNGLTLSDGAFRGVSTLECVPVEGQTLFVVEGAIAKWNVLVEIK